MAKDMDSSARSRPNIIAGLGNDLPSRLEPVLYVSERPRRSGEPEGDQFAYGIDSAAKLIEAFETRQALLKTAAQPSPSPRKSRDFG